LSPELERILNEESSQNLRVEYRTNFQSRALRKCSPPLASAIKLVGGFSFYKSR